MWVRFPPGARLRSSKDEHELHTLGARVRFPPPPPKDHPSRGETDTYYLDDTHILRTQMTVMWPYYFRDKEVLERLKTEGGVGSLSPGIVFRKDEIDRKHFPAFHQTDFFFNFHTKYYT